MPRIREFTKKLGAEICKKFEVLWTHGDEERIEQLQEIIIQEEEEAEKRKAEGHISEEAQETANRGVLAYGRINETYQKYLAKEIEEHKL